MEIWSLPSILKSSFMALYSYLYWEVVSVIMRKRTLVQERSSFAE